MLPSLYISHGSPMLALRPSPARVFLAELGALLQRPKAIVGPPHHLQLGRAIAALREQDVLVIGSGSFTHNLGRPRAPDLDAPAPPDVIAFADWMHAALTGRRVDDLLDYRRKAPYAALQHPTEEHLLPLFVALGAAGDGARATRLHASATWGTLRMDAYSFDG